MRALPMPKDTIDLLVTAAFITQSVRCTCHCTMHTVADLNTLGQSLWDENYATVQLTTLIPLRSPRYRWQPVAELLGSGWTNEQVLQVARTRLYAEEVSCHHPGWDDSPAHHTLEDLAGWIAKRMVGHPLQQSPTDAGVIEYAGLDRLPEVWTREIGWRENLSPAAIIGLSQKEGLS